MDGPNPSPLRALPSLQRLLESPEAQSLACAHSRLALATALRTALAEARDALRAGHPLPPPLPRAAALLAATQRLTLRRTINATGILLHTNLGRAPLAPEAIAALTDAAAGYSNLELDLETGARSSRLQNVEPLLRQLTGAEAALVTNNNAAAILLALAGLAGGEIIVSRGELVEIGGGFRIPEVIAQSGARLVEIGATNRTRLADYQAAITPATRAILKVHPSNYRIEGFTQSTPLAGLAPLAHAHRLLLIDDQGTGNLRPPQPTLADSIAAGADLVAGSGDKLLGGPQAGLLVGTATAIAPLRRHPLFRALRPDKLQLAALEATLRLHLTAPHRIPILAMLAQTEQTLQSRAETLLSLLPSLPAHIAPTTAYAGGGTLPTDAIPSRALLLATPHPDTLARRLRTNRPAIVARIANQHLVLDMLAVADADLPEIAAALHG